MSLRHIWLLMALLLSAIAVVMTQHQARKLYIRLHETREQTRKLEVERTELQVEQGTLSAHSRIEALARERLDMAIPAGPLVQTLPDAALVPGAPQ